MYLNINNIEARGKETWWQMRRECPNSFSNFFPLRDNEHVNDFCIVSLCVYLFNPRSLLKLNAFNSCPAGEWKKCTSRDPHLFLSTHNMQQLSHSLVKSFLIFTNLNRGHGSKNCELLSCNERLISAIQGS